MAFLDVHVNTDPSRRLDIPFVVEFQADVMSNLPSCLVVPLFDPDRRPQLEVKGVMPRVDFQGRVLLAMVPFMAAIARKQLAHPVGSMAHQRDTFIRALDQLVLGS